MGGEAGNHCGIVSETEGGVTGDSQKVIDVEQKQCRRQDRFLGNSDVGRKLIRRGSVQNNL